VLGFAGVRVAGVGGAFVLVVEVHALRSAGVSALQITRVVVPAALAVAEREGSTGRELIAAVVAGYEVMIRLGVALQPSLFGDRRP